MAMTHYQEPDNMSEELHELHEHAEHAREHPDLAPITITMAILAVLVATVSLLGHRTHTEEVILQNKVTDQWSYFQAKKIRQHTDELFADLAGAVAARDAEAATKLQEKARSEADRYKDDQKDLGDKAHELEQEFAVTHRKADRFDLGEVFLEIALVITSITLLSGRRIYWHLGLLMAAAGVVIACSAWLLH
ncbi:MAG: DUF4337 domain-containing protein [Terriglobales bacterium]